MAEGCPNLAERSVSAKKDRRSGVGNMLNNALAALEEANAPALADVGQHIDFTRKVGQTTLPGRKLEQLIDHFDRYRLQNEGFGFPGPARR